MSRAKSKGYFHVGSESDTISIVAYIIDIYACYGKITNRYDFCSMNIVKSKKVGIVADPRN